ncbi:ATP synthase subunit B [Medicago truncatula]|uniref:ATP synthase subunit B n=1 Tax=Medicago truncatula TaxID=3880 RepID=G7JIL1_MEDTR|nr:ATP synthase subunit B [Medicago truncatula]
MDRNEKQVFCLTPPFIQSAVEQLEKVWARLRKVETEADRFRVNGYSEIEREKLNLINSIYTTLEQFENYTNETIHFEQQRKINQVQQRVLSTNKGILY